jgi:hypothetical protein
VTLRVLIDGRFKRRAAAAEVQKSTLVDSAVTIYPRLSRVVRVEPTVPYAPATNTRYMRPFHMAFVAARSSASSSGAGMGTLVLVARTTSEEPRLHRCPRGGYAADGASEARALCRRNCAVLAVTVG